MGVLGCEFEIVLKGHIWVIPHVLSARRIGVQREGLGHEGKGLESAHFCFRDVCCDLNTSSMPICTSITYGV